MQRGVRSALVALLTIAGLLACGDEITAPPAVIKQTAVDSVVRSVTVSPPSLTMNIGDRVPLAASVDAGSAVSDRTVTWSSSNRAIATVDASGVVIAVSPGLTSIIAASKANSAVKGAALIAVSAGAQAATVTISSINETICRTGGCFSIPANLGNVSGQLDVTLNVDPGGQTLAGVNLLMNCNAAGGFPAASDTVVATQSFSSGTVAPVAEAASAPVTLSFNTAWFNGTTGATGFKNGACQLKGRVRTMIGTVAASSTTSLTLGNASVAVGTVTSTKTSTDQLGLLWNGGDVTVSVIPVFYEAGRRAATTSITFEGKTRTLTNAVGAAVTATFTDGNGSNAGSAMDIDGITDANAAATLSVAIIDASGQPFTTNPCGASTICTPQSVLAGNPVAVSATSFLLDTQKPAAGTLAIHNNALQGTGSSGYVGANFRFAADSAAGFRGPNANSATTSGNICPDNNGIINSVTCNADFGGVTKVTVVFQVGTAGASKSSSSWVTTTSAASLSETTSSTALSFRQITVDALGNADTTVASADGAPIPAVTFGVDKTNPTLTQSAGAHWPGK